MQRIISIIPDEHLNNELANALKQLPDVQVVRALTLFPNLEELLRTIRVRRPDCLLIQAEDLSHIESLIAGLDDLAPGLPIIGVGQQADAELLRRLMHLGVREYLTPPLTSLRLAEIVDSVQRHLRKHPAPAVRSADLYSFFPAKPGVGTSTIALSTSCAIADELGARTLLVDADLAAGVIKFLLKLGNSSSILDAIARSENLDEDLWSQLVGKCGKLDVLHAGQLDVPPRDGTSLQQVLSLARAQYEVICADLASSLDPFTVEWMRESRRIFLVTTPEVVAVHLAQARLESLTDLGLADRVSLILNRKDRRSDHLEDAEVAHMLDIPVAYSFTNNYDHVQKSILGGSPVAQNSDVGQNVLNLAHSMVMELPGKEVQPHRRRFLEFFHVPHTEDVDHVWHG